MRDWVTGVFPTVCRSEKDRKKSEKATRVGRAGEKNQMETVCACLVAALSTKTSLVSDP